MKIKIEECGRCGATNNEIQHLTSCNLCKDCIEELRLKEEEC